MSNIRTYFIGGCNDGKDMMIGERDVTIRVPVYGKRPVYAETGKEVARPSYRTQIYRVALVTPHFQLAIIDRGDPENAEMQVLRALLEWYHLKSDVADRVHKIKHDLRGIYVAPATERHLENLILELESILEDIK